MKETTVKLGNAVYKVELHNINRLLGYTIYRNGKIVLNSTCPVSNKQDVKMYISEYLIQNACYEINHQIQQLEI